MSYYEREIPFAASFPLPFRVLFLAGLGILGWATNLHGLNLLGIDGASALELRKASSEYSPVRSALPTHRGAGFKLVQNPAATYEPIYRLFAVFAIWCFCLWVVFEEASNFGNVLLVDVFRYVPAICALGILMILVCPFEVVYKRERDMFLQAIRRCLFSPLDRPVYFSDVIFADIFTSFAKVLGDIWLSICMLLPGASLLVLPTQEGLSRWILPTIMSLPYLVRLRQCIAEHSSPLNTSRRPLYNAIKYASSFPVIYLSAAQRPSAAQLEEGVEGSVAVFRLWLLAAAVNSLYSFWWDVTNDWGLELLKFTSPRPTANGSAHKATSPPRPLVLPSLHSTSPSPPRSSASSPSTSHTTYPPTNYQTNNTPFGLRSTLLYPLPAYPLLIFLNLLLRLTWSIKLSSHLHAHSSEGSVVIFWLEVAEVVRRWMWVFVRVEWEVIKKMQTREGRRLTRVDGEYDGEEYELPTPIPNGDGFDGR